ncbi:MAG: hypothetical protein OXD47_05955 [Gammaproteobacteria bacterium]|nr:hypothetical protein [Gammaproteobacteria bacterium]
MRYSRSNMRNHWPWFCLLLTLLPPLTHAAVVFDEEGHFIEVTEDHASFSSYALEDYDVSFQDVLKLNGTELFMKGADLTNGIRGTVQNGGWIDLKAFVYDKNHNKHPVYHARLEADSADAYSTGSPQTININIHKHDENAPHAVSGVEIKTLLQSVKDAYQVTKEDLDQLLRHTAAQEQQSYGNRQGRSWWRALLGAAVGAAVGAVAAVAVVATGGTGIIAVPVAAALIVGASSFLGGYAGLSYPGGGASPSQGSQSESTESSQDSQPQSTESPQIAQVGSIDKTSYHDLPKSHKVVPNSAYPVQVVLELNNAKFIAGKIPGIPQLTPALFQAWNVFSSTELKDRLAKQLWSDSPGVLNEDDRELAFPQFSTGESFAADDLSSSSAKVRLIVNPVRTDTESFYTFTADSNSPNNAPHLTLGDHITLEVAVPISNANTFQADNPAHYPKLIGFPHTWMAFFSGEVLFQFDRNIRPGAWRPWLGFDSQVHGTVMRKYPPNYTPKFYDWNANTALSSEHVVFRWTAKLTRRMDANKSAYGAAHDWSKIKIKPVRQRNNQKEGLNMELMRAWQSVSSEETPAFATYHGNTILPGLDPDEFLYLRDTEGVVTDIITLDGEPWKTVPEDESAGPINDIVTAYYKNRLWHVDGKDYRSVHGLKYVSSSHEIQDLGTSGTAPNGNGTGNSAAPGWFRLELPAFTTTQPDDPETITVPITVSAPLETDKGFYGNISGSEYPAIWEKGVLYKISGLRSVDVENYAVSFIHEDSLGQRKYLNFFSSQMPQHIRNRIRDTGEWLVAVPSFLGYGYYSVNLWYRNASYTDSWTRIGGKELLDVSLRFLSVPGSRSGEGTYTGIDLKEAPGDGAYIYLEEFLDAKHADFQLSKYGRYTKAQVRTYVFHRGETSTFLVMDADPHTFTHPGTEWYLSARTQAKRLTDAQLATRVRFYVDPINDDGSVTEDHTVDGTGRKFTHQWNQAGVYQLKVSYNGTSSVAHRIVVVDPTQRQGDIKADIRVRALTAQEQSWLRGAGVTLGNTTWKLVTLENVDSKYRYIDGPRAHTDRSQTNRFHPGLDYADSYQWKITSGSGGSATSYDIAQNGPTGLATAVANYKDGAGWLPRAFVRHTSEVNSAHRAMPDDIANGSVAVDRFSELSEDQQNRLEQMFTDVPEPWQVRLPWISFVTDPNPYSDNGMVRSYRTRTNIKVLYNMPKFFDNDSGAFSGNPPDPAGGGGYDHQNLVNRGIFLHLMNDDTKLKRVFFQDLATARVIIYGGSYSRIQVSNAKNSDTVIAELEP